MFINKKSHKHKVFPISVAPLISVWLCKLAWETAQTIHNHTGYARWYFGNLLDCLGLFLFIHFIYRSFQSILLINSKCENVPVWTSTFFMSHLHCTVVRLMHALLYYTTTSTAFQSILWYSYSIKTLLIVLEILYW